VRYIRDRCEEEKVSFFFKQWGGIKKHASGRVLDGKIWDEKPTLIRKANCTEV
jgi:protein gp37